MEHKAKRIAIYIILSVTAIFFLLSPVYSLFIDGIYHWHIIQPELWRDGLELFIYIMLILIISLVADRIKGLVVLAAVSIYLLSTGTLLQCIVSYLYIEVIILIGRSFLAVLFKREREYSAGVCFLAGSICWGTVAIAMSLLGVGTIVDLRVMTVVLVLAAVLLSRNQKEHILVIQYLKYMNRSGRKEFLVNIFFVLIMMISCARVNTHIEFDSYWYALYTDKCLFGERSFYDYLGYTDFVYYYPKFKELLMAPISGLGLPGYLISANLWITVLSCIEAYQYMRTQNVKGNKIQVLSVLYLIFSTVCIIGISGTAKSDAISYLYILMLILYIARYFQQGEQVFLWISVASGIMSYTVKYTSFLFSTLIFTLAAVTMIHFWRGRERRRQKFCWQGLLFVLLALFIFGGVLYRTYKLTGYLTYREATGIWQALGFEGKPYFDALIADKPDNVMEPGRILSVLFDVDSTEKIRAQWMGNYVVFFPFCLLCLYRERRKDRNTFMMAAVLMLDVVSLYFLVTMAAPDGNYFSVAVILSTCYVLIRMMESRYWNIHKKWFSVIVGMFMALNLLFVFVTHPSWKSGTRFSEEPVQFFMSEGEKYKRVEGDIRELGMYRINERLKEIGGKDFILVDGGDDSRACMLDARVEIAAGLFHSYISGAGINDYSSFVQYVEYAGVDGFILVEDGTGMEPFCSYVRWYIAENGSIEQINEKECSYYRISVK